MKRGRQGTSTPLFIIPSPGDSSGLSVSDGLFSTVELGDIQEGGNSRRFQLESGISESIRMAR